MRYSGIDPSCKQPPPLALTMQVVFEVKQAMVCSKLITEYARELGEDLCFQHLDAELQDPLKKYGPPGGLLLLATGANMPLGCVAYQKIAEGVCEMKRLYVVPGFRTFGIATALVKYLCGEAKKNGYQTMVLDTLTRLTAAVQLYNKLGFIITEPYYQNPLPGVLYMTKML